MRLKSIKFTEFEGQRNEWHFDCTWGDINLVVGRNATGKTRLLNVVSDLAKLLSGENKIISFTNYEVIFDHEGQAVKYLLKKKPNQVVYEKLMENSNLLLQRRNTGIGQIWSESLKQMLDFQPPIDKLAVVNRRDKIQHPFLEKLYDWATNTRQFSFSTSMGQDDISDLQANSPLLDNVVAVFAKGEQTFGLEFLNLIKSNMQTIGYWLESVSTVPITVNPKNQQPLYNLMIEEKDLSTPVFQFEISSGMFRALSLLIQINYLLLAGQPSCIIIDDIGEGLDFNRSTQLIKLLIEKVKGSQIQLIMSTNDQFVMDAVPLEYWQIIQREGNQLKIYNYHNSKAIFDKFEFTGLGNFDFFSSNYFLRTTPAV